MSFARSERVAFKDFISPAFVRFLKKCYCKFSVSGPFNLRFLSYFLLAVHECRDRALPDPSEFSGLASIEEHGNVELHPIEDNRMAEDDYVRTADPRPKPPAGSRPAQGHVPKERWTTQSVMKTPQTLPPIKFGPPRSSTKLASTEVSTKDVPTLQPIPPNTAVEQPTSVTPDGSAARSRGPTPSVSRAPTPPPVPSVSSSAIATPPIELAKPNTETPATFIVGDVAVDCVSASLSSGPNAANGHANPSLVSRAALTGPLAPPLAVTALDEQAVSSAASVSTHPTACATDSPPRLPLPRACSPAPADASTLQLSPNRNNLEDASDFDVDAAIAQTNSAAATGVTVASPAAALHTSSSTALTDPRLDLEDQLTHAAMDVACSDGTTSPSASPSLLPSACVSSAIPPGSASVPDMEVLAAEECEKKAKKRRGRALSGAPRSKKKRGGQPQAAANSTSSSRTVSAASSQNSTATLVDAPDAPPWVTKALKLFRSVALGSEWDALLSRWLQFEQQSQFQGDTRLGAKNRPGIVGDWIQRARPSEFHFKIQGVRSFNKNFNVWWISLQPDWRTNDPSGVLLRSGGDWGRLRCPGVNGLLSVLAALFFWGREVQKQPDESAAWVAAVDDVYYAIAQLL